LAFRTLRSIGDGIIATDREGRVTFVNPIAESLTGWSAAEAVGRPLDEVFSVVSESTREPVDNLAERAGESVPRSGHTFSTGSARTTGRRRGRTTVSVSGLLSFAK
jgi:PAS domain S-box-containing protein